MKTTVDIPDHALKELMKNVGSKVKRDAIVAAIEEFNKKRRLEKLVGYLGTFEDLISKEELLKLRKASRL